MLGLTKHQEALSLNQPGSARAGRCQLSRDGSEVPPRSLRWAHRGHILREPMGRGEEKHGPAIPADRDQDAGERPGLCRLEGPPIPGAARAGALGHQSSNFSGPRAPSLGPQCQCQSGALLESRC